MIPFNQELGYSGKCGMLSAIHTDQMHQPWQTFAAIINRCISGKSTALDRLREFKLKNVDYVALLWEEFMYQVNNREISSARKEQMPYPRFTKVIIKHFISKDKSISMRNRINLHTVRDDSLLDIKDSEAYKTYYDFASGKVAPKKAMKFKNITSPSQKLVIIKDTHGVSVSKKKAPSKADRGKGMKLLSNATLLEVAQVKEALKKSKQDSHMLHASGSDDGVGSQPKVPDESEDKTTSIDEGTVLNHGFSIDDDNDDDNVSENKDDNSKNDDADSDADNSEKTDSDDDENPKFNMYDEEEEVNEDEYVHTPTPEYGFSDNAEYEDLYGDVNVNLKDAEHEEGKGDKEMIDAGRENVSQEQAYEQVVDDAYIKDHNEEHSPQTSSLLKIPTSSTAATSTIPPSILSVSPLPQQSTTTLAPTTDSIATSLPTLLDFSSLFGFNQRVSALEQEMTQLKQGIIKDEVKSILPQILPKEVSNFATLVIQSTSAESIENVVFTKSSSQPTSTYEAAASLTEFELKKILLDKIQKSKSYQAAPEHRKLYDALVKSYKFDKDLFESYGNTYSLKRDRDDKDKDEDPRAGSNQGLKKRKTSKDVELPKGFKSKESKSSSSKGTKSQPKSSGKSVQAEETMFEAADTKMPQD
ncbi:hypothetical protein Tco_0086602 [Tanacetum coccineum]